MVMIVSEYLLSNKGFIFQKGGIICDTERLLSTACIFSICKQQPPYLIFYYDLALHGTGGHTSDHELA